MTFLYLSPTAKESRSIGMRNTIDADALAGYLEAYADPKPALPGGEVPLEGLLGTIPLTKPCGTVNETGLHVTAAAFGQVQRAGTPTWGRFRDGAGNWVMDASMGIEGSGAVLIIDKESVLPGALLRLTAADLAEGG